MAKLNFKQKRTWFLIIAVAFFVATCSVLIDDTPQTQQAQTAITDSQLDLVQDNQITDTKEKDFGITPNELDIQVNKIAGNSFDFGQELKIDDGAFTKNLTENLVWQGSVNDNGNVASVGYALLASSDKIEEDGVNLMMHVGATARVLSPELPKEQSAGQVLKLFESVSNEFTKTNQPAFGERVIDGYKYSLSINPQIGMIVGNIEKI